MNNTIEQTPALQRVAIAKDILARIESQTITPTFDSVLNIHITGKNLIPGGNSAKIFPEKMLAEIETLLKGTVFNFNACMFSDDEIRQLINYMFKNFKGPNNKFKAKERMKKIFQLLIDSNGEKIVLES